MTTTNIPVGTQVYVNWYGNVVQGEVAAPCSEHLFSGMVSVLLSIPASNGTPIVPGCRNVCMYHRKRLYATAEEAKAAQGNIINPSSPLNLQNLSAPPCPKTDEQTASLDTLRARYLQFKADNWDEEHKHIKVSALDDFYQLWRTCIAAKRGYQEEKPTEETPITPIQPIHPIKPITKPTKKQKRSTGRIEYRDCIQTSLFD